ncbi:hypothetical protein GMSM_37940 [Geomonas sp. Red276]
MVGVTSRVVTFALEGAGKGPPLLQLLNTVAARALVAVKAMTIKRATADGQRRLVREMNCLITILGTGPRETGCRYRAPVPLRDLPGDGAVRWVGEKSPPAGYFGFYGEKMRRKMEGFCRG